MRWRDDLPPLPTEEMLTDAVSEGSRRIRRRQQRLALVLGGAAVVATGLVVATVTGVFIDDSEEADQGGATVAVVPSESAATAAGTAAEGTSAIEPAGTEAAGAAPGIEGAGGAATEPPETEVGATTSPPEIVASKQITLIPAQVWEQPASGTECGPTTVAVRYTPRDRALAKAVVVWAGSFGMNQSPMEIVDNVATATIGPFPPHTVGTEIVAEPLSVTVIATGTDGSVAVLQPQVELTLAACPT